MPISTLKSRLASAFSFTRAPTTSGPRTASRQPSAPSPACDPPTPFLAHSCTDLLLFQDFLLWNRLGATLANSGRPEEAIDAYRKALELRPTFTRAIYNLGVSCLNVHCYQEAAEHLLAALDLQRSKGNGRYPLTDEDKLAMDDGSDNLWHTLRRAFLQMVRPIAYLLIDHC